MLQKYPYQTVMDQLSNGADSERDPCHVFQSLMVVVGRTIRDGSRERRAHLLHKLRQPLGAGIRGSSQHLPHEASDSESFASSDQGRFASALIEYGQEHGGFKPIYRYEGGSTRENGFMAVVKCGKLTVTAEGKSKKQARQAAAYQACLHFRVSP